MALPAHASPAQCPTHEAVRCRRRAQHTRHGPDPAGGSHEPEGAPCRLRLRGPSGA